MDQKSLVNDKLDDGRRLIERFVADVSPIEVAFWALLSEEEHWFLYLATDLVDRESALAAYRAVRETLSKLEHCRLTGSEIKVLSTHSNLAQDVGAYMARFPARLATILGGKTLGNLVFDQLYIYPPQIYASTANGQMTTEEVGREILRLMNRSGHPSASGVVLKDGGNFHGVPFALEYETPGGVVARFIVEREVVPRSVRLDAIAAIN